MIKIQDGCDNMCTFCIVPHVRGRALSRPLADVLANIREVCELGFKEIILTGVNIGRYDHDGSNFEALVAQILELPGDFRVRISSIEPDGFGEALFDLLSHPRMTPHMHLCLQSGSNRVLRRMRRMYTLEGYRGMIGEIRGRIPDFNFTTDVIVGFPGETQEDFNETLRVVKDVGFTHVHTFKYSVREGTRAARMDEQVSDEVKAERSRAIRDVSEDNKRRFYRGMQGKQQRVLVERNLEGEAYGLGQHYVPVKIRDEDLKENEYVDVELVGVEEAPKLVCVGKRNSEVRFQVSGGLTTESVHVRKPPS
jgi:threonylcarbamoyladenosine tRNA methylthiotransferase MtaB